MQVLTEENLIVLSKLETKVPCKLLKLEAKSSWLKLETKCQVQSNAYIS